MKKTKLKILREKRGFTQEYMANKIGVSVVAYHMYETNQRRVPVDRAKKIATVLDAKMEDIFLPKKFAIR